jgi:hypothetical protein
VGLATGGRLGSLTQRAVDGARDLLTRAGTDGGRQRHAPAFGSALRALQPQIGQDGRLIDVHGDLLGAALSGEMLSTRQRRPARLTGQPNEIIGDQRDRAARALLPGRVGHRIDHDLAHHSPTSMMRVAPGYEKSSERVRHSRRFGLSAVLVEMAQGRTDAPATLDCAGELPRRPLWLMSFVVDASPLVGRGPS